MEARPVVDQGEGDEAGGHRVGRHVGEVLGMDGDGCGCGRLRRGCRFLVAAAGGEGGECANDRHVRDAGTHGAGLNCGGDEGEWDFARYDAPPGLRRQCRRRESPLEERTLRECEGSRVLSTQSLVDGSLARHPPDGSRTHVSIRAVCPDARGRRSAGCVRRSPSRPARARRHRDDREDPRRRPAPLAGHGPHDLVGRHLRAAPRGQPGHGEGRAVGDEDARIVGSPERARGALPLRQGVGTAALLRRDGRAAGAADHRHAQSMDARHQWARGSRGRASRHPERGRLREVPRHAARQDRAHPAGAHGAHAHGQDHPHVHAENDR